MEKEIIIKMVQSSRPSIDNLSDRTWSEVAEALTSVMHPDADMKESICKVFKTISGQIRHDVSEQLKKALLKQKNQHKNELNTWR